MQRYNSSPTSHGYTPQNRLSYTVHIPSYITGIYELKEMKYI